MRSSDVVVVGGGPAGSVSALLLARAGFEVVLLERRVFPRPKPCGDCLSPGANVVLRRLGLWNAVLAAEPARLKGWWLGCLAGAAFSSTFSAPGLTAPISLALPRERFDAILIDAAQSAGVHVRMGWRVSELLRDSYGQVTGVRAESTYEHREIKARLVIGADGLRSRVARLLQAHTRLPRIHKLSLTAHLRGVDCQRDFGEMHVHRDACLGLARVESGTDPLYNVTVVLAAKRKRADGPVNMLRSALLEFGRADIADIVSDDTVVLASGPFDWPVRQVSYDGAALVGDAAGYFDPFTGQGIYQALIGAELLAQHAAIALESGSATAAALRGYERDQHARFAGTRRLQRAIDFVCAKPVLTHVAFRAFARSPELAQRLIAVTGDLRPARSLFFPAA